MHKKHANSIGIAPCLVELTGTAPTDIRLLPAGQFKARDSRPHGLKGWRLEQPQAEKILLAAQHQQDAYLIDYDHQTLYSKDHGQPAKAAGWFRVLEWRTDGLYALGVEWTEAAKQAIAAKEYRYISPVLTYHKTTGEVTGLLMAALVNYPAIDGLTDLAAAHFNLPPHEDPMNTELVKLLGLSAEADDAAVVAAVSALQSQTAALSAQVDGLKNQTPDPAKFVPIDAMTALQTQIASLSAQLHQDKLSKLIEPALADGRLLPAQKAWAESLGQSDLAALQAYLDSAPPIAALQGTQTRGQAPTHEPTTELTADEVALCKHMGIAVDDFKKTKGAD